MPVLSQFERDHILVYLSLGFLSLSNFLFLLLLVQSYYIHNFYSIVFI